MTEISQNCYIENFRLKYLII